MLQVAARLGSRGRDEGFSLIEMVVAVTMLGAVMMFTAQLLYGGLGALSAATDRSSFLEIANGEIESMRALPYDAVGVRTSDPDYTTAYSGSGTPRTHDGRDAVAIGDADFTPPIRAAVPAAVAVVSSSPVEGLPLPYTVRRWVTWDTVSGGPARAFKRLEVRLEWTENRRVARRLVLHSVLYPGDTGVPVGNRSPNVVLTYSPACVIAGATPVQLSSAGTSDPDGDALVSYAWEYGDGATSTLQPPPTRTYAAAGTYNARLRVTDARGATGEATRPVSVVSPDNGAPVIQTFSVSPLTGIAPVTVTAAATATDPTNDPLTYTWSWGDGSPNSTGQNVGHRYLAAGSYAVSLTVSDGCLTATRAETVVVSPLNCAVTSAFFKNPPTGTSNLIRVNKQGAPTGSGPDVLMEASTNAACSSVEMRVPTNAGEVKVSLALAVDGGSVRTWRAQGNHFAGHKFDLGSGQRAAVWTNASSGTQASHYFNFSVELA